MIPIMEEWEVCVQKWSNPDKTAHLHPFGELAVHEDPLSPSTPEF